MLRRTLRRAQTAIVDDGSTNALGKVEGYQLIGRTKTSSNTAKRYREKKKFGEEEILQQGINVKKSALELVDRMREMENPMIWVWHPWRKSPEPPLPSFPCPNALKNLNGALLSELSPKQIQRRQEAMYANVTEPEVTAKLEARHPFLKQILEETAGRRTAFPFFFKKYPTRRHAIDARFDIPTEMIEGLPTELQRTLSVKQMTEKDKIKRELNLYTWRYATHDLEESSPSINSVRAAIRVRELRNHLLSNPNNNILKFHLANNERRLRKHLRVLRKLDFRKYWEILRDHDMMDVMQAPTVLALRYGNYWKHDWAAGQALTVNIPDFMDPRGMNGCIETGRSRAEVARDLGLSYTRHLTPRETKFLSQSMLYWSQIQKFKIESPEEYKRRERLRFINKFTSLHVKTSAKTSTHDFPSKFRRLVGTKILRWKSARHGPE